MSFPRYISFSSQACGLRQTDGHMEQTGQTAGLLCYDATLRCFATALLRSLLAHSTLTLATSATPAPSALSVCAVGLLHRRRRRRGVADATAAMTSALQTSQKEFSREKSVQGTAPTAPPVSAMCRPVGSTSYQCSTE